jgi:tripartite motif-containing protein 2/3/tripartite motif-containing protein 71
MDKHRVSVFSTDGKFICRFGSHGTNKDQFHYPGGITIDNEECLYICDSDNDRLVITID